MRARQPRPWPTCEQTHEKKPRTTDRATQSTTRSDCGRESVGQDKACQADAAMARAYGEVGLVVHGDTLSRVCGACAACGGDSTESNPVSVLVPPATPAVLEEEVEKQVTAAMASAAAARAGASAWASAFSAARDLFRAALVSLCEQATGGLGPAEGEGHAFMVPLLAGVGAPGGSNKATSSAVVPWVPGEAKSEATMALEALRYSVQSATEGILLTAERTARTASPPAPTVTTTGSQTLPEPLPPVAPVVRQNTRGSQTDEEPKEGARVARLHHVSVQTSRPGGLDFGSASGAGAAGGAPAWEGDIDGRCCETENGDGDRERRRNREDKERMEGLERTVGALNEALQRAEAEKGDLELKLSMERQEVRVPDAKYIFSCGSWVILIFRHDRCVTGVSIAMIGYSYCLFFRLQATQVKRQRDMFEADIGQLHASTLALVHDVS